MLEAYEDEGIFGKSQNDEFLAVYNANKDGFDVSSVEYANLNYKTGMMYFNYYTEDDGTYSFSTRVQKAYPFFSDNFNNKNISAQFESKQISDCYYQICSFYKTYILNSTNVEEASKDNYNKLFDVIDSAIDNVQSASAYDQLSFYNGVFMLLYDQRSSMVQVAVNQDKVINLLDDVYKKATSLEVQKEQSQKLKNEMTNNYDDYRNAIIRAYTNAQERS